MTGFLVLRHVSGRPFRGALRGALVPCLITVLASCGRSSPDDQSTVAPPDSSRDLHDRRPLLVDVSTSLGLPEPAPWPDGTWFLPEIMGGGVALFDADGDDDLDLLHVLSPPPAAPGAATPNRYFEQSEGRFEDATASSGLGDLGFGQGVTSGDVDGDGRVDLYVANYGEDVLYGNLESGRFAPQASAGIAGNRWSTSAAFVDYDRDGHLDLYVVHYVDYYSGVTCRAPNGDIDYCPPKKFKGTPDALYHNRGDGTFENTTVPAGIGIPTSGLGVTCADFDRDGWTDIFVANDGEVNQMWMNRGNGTFVDEAVMRGVGFNGSGMPEGSMGVAVGDVDGDGTDDLLVTNLWNESNTLLTGSPHGVFADHSGASGMAPVDLPFTGFGCGFFDIDHDADLDFAVVNGRVARWPQRLGDDPGNFWTQYGEPNLLFTNEGDGRFARLGDAAAGIFALTSEVDRGLAFGDIDRDGDIDLAVGGLNRVRLLRNDAPAPGSHWLSVRAVVGKRDALGAEVVVVIGEHRLRRLVHAAHSYASSSNPRAHFGLGAHDAVDAVEIRWPGGDSETFAVTAVDGEITLHRGEGVAW